MPQPKVNATATVGGWSGRALTNEAIPYAVHIEPYAAKSRAGLGRCGPIGQLIDPIGYDVIGSHDSRLDLV